MPEACTVSAVVGAASAAVVAVADSFAVVVAGYGCTAEGGVGDEHGGTAGVPGESGCRKTAAGAVARNTGCSEEAIEGFGRLLGRRRQEPEAGGTSW